MTWKHVLILTLFAVYQMAGTCPAEAALLAVDDFESYTAGTGLNGGAGGTGWKGSWVTHDEIVVASGVIDGNTLDIDVATQTAAQNNFGYRSFPTITSGDVYIGFELQTTGGWSSGDFQQWYVNAIRGSIGADSSAPSAVAGTARDKFAARVGWTGGPNSATTLADGATYQVVMKLSKNSAVYDTSTLYINQTTEGTPDSTATWAGTNMPYLNTYHLRTSGVEAGKDIHIDSLRVATTYAEALATEPAPVASDFGGVDSFVTGAGGYTVDANLLGQHPDASGFLGDWFQTSGGDNGFRVVASGLDTAAAGYETGGSVQINPAADYTGNNVIFRALEGQASSPTYYFSGMISPNVDSEDYSANGQQAFITLDTHEAVLNFGLRGQDGTGKVAFRAIEKASPDYTPVTIREGYSANETLFYLIKAEVDAGDAGNDRLTFILNPTDLGSEAQALATAEATVVTTDYDLYSDTSAFNWIELNVNNMPGATITFDELRFGATFEEVVAVPEPAAAVLLVFGVMAMLAGTRRRCR